MRSAIPGRRGRLAVVVAGIVSAAAVPMFVVSQSGREASAGDRHAGHSASVGTNPQLPGVLLWQLHAGERDGQVHASLPGGGAFEGRVVESEFVQDDRGEVFSSPSGT